ncbi:hypothetical protein Tco_0550256 [Tanacetum coccineum]
MSLANLKAITEYQEGIQATEDIESPAVGFAKTSDYKRGLTNQVNAVIKQNNILLYLASKKSHKLIKLEEKFDRLKQKVHTIIEKEIQPADLEDSISSLAKDLITSQSVEKSLSSTQTTELPTQEDQICGYRAMTRGRYQAVRATRRVFGRNNYNITLESAVDPKRQLELSREMRANLVLIKVLYSNNRSTARHSLQHIHLGIFMIRLHALHRRSAGTNALVVLRDTRWEDSRQIIGTIDVDLFAGTQLVYMFPDMVLSIDDFHNHVEVAIQTHGYDTVDNVVDHLTTTGITAIPGERRSVEELEGMSWNLKPFEQTMDCLNEARTLEEEPLNKAKRSNKPKRSKQRSWEKWSTLGEPSGKWDYYVRYDTPTNTVPIEEITATGWGDEFSDNEATTGKVTIIDEKEDWDNDERSGGKILALQE